MSSVQQPQSEALSRDVLNAFTALRTYDAGSSRALLLPLDAVVARAISNVKLKVRIEHQLLAVLATKPHRVAIEYVCSKLGLIGSEKSVSALARLLAEPQVSTAARNALEKIPSTAASKALRKAVSKLPEPQRAGVLLSLGGRRDKDSIELCAGAVLGTDPNTAAVGAYALGNIGSINAGERLNWLMAKAPPDQLLSLSDAALICAEHLLAEGHKAEAKCLYKSLTGAPHPKHICEAALRGLQNC